MVQSAAMIDAILCNAFLNRRTSDMGSSFAVNHGLSRRVEHIDSEMAQPGANHCHALRLSFLG